MPGIACTNRMLRFTVTAPNTPATITQATKNSLTWKPSAPSARPQARPAARKPLYRPWLAASAFDAAANSGVSRKILRPRGVSQRNISSTRKPACRSAARATATFATVVIYGSFESTSLKASWNLIVPDTRSHVAARSPRYGVWPRTAHARAIKSMAPSAAIGSLARMRSRSAPRRSSVNDIAYPGAGACPPRNGVQ